jgi:DNA polymerase III subunit epsilon
MPGRISYSLGNLCASIGIEINGRHRAEGDALATAKLFDLLLLLKSQDPQYKNKGIDEIMLRRVDKIKKYILDKLPEDCGVYYFLNKAGEIIYVGKSKNMYNGALSHFNSKENKGKKMLHDLYNVDHVLTGSELIALLLESEEIKKHKPFYNRMRKAEDFTHCIHFWKDKKGVLNFGIAESNQEENMLRRFVSYSAARECLENWVEDFELCLSYCNLVDGDSSCFNHQIRKCRGICHGEESLENYNRRANRLVCENSFENKNFILIDKGRNPEERSMVLIEDGNYRGYTYIDQYSQIGGIEEMKAQIKCVTFFPDSDDLVRSWMKQNKVLVKVF